MNDGITIRAMREADLPGTTALRNLPLVRWGTLATPYESLHRSRQLHAAKPARDTLVACAGAEIVGHAGLHRNPHGRRAHASSLGICVHDDWHGQGIGSRLMAALTDLADNWLGLRRLELEVFADNAKALALYGKFGFTVEATLRADAFRAGAFVDSLAMSRLRDNLITSRLHGDLGASRLRGDLAAEAALRPPSPPAPAPAAPVTLRAAEPADLPAITALMNQPLVRHFTLRTPYTTEEENKHLAAPDDPARSILAIADGVAIGIGVLRPGKTRRAHCGEVALLAVHDAWTGRGIGGALLAALVDLADNWLNLRRLHLHVLADNEPALRLYARHGFTSEGLCRADLFRAGHFADSAILARHKP